MKERTAKTQVNDYCLFTCCVLVSAIDQKLIIPVGIEASYTIWWLKLMNFWWKNFFCGRSCVECLRLKICNRQCFHEDDRRKQKSSSFVGLFKSLLMLNFKHLDPNNQIISLMILWILMNHDNLTQILIISKRQSRSQKQNGGKNLQTKSKFNYAPPKMKFRRSSSVFYEITK